MSGTLVPFGSLIPRREDLFAPFENYFNKIFDEFFTDSGRSCVKGRVGYPKIDVLIEKDKWIVEVAAPGATADDITVELLPCQEKSTKRVLKISGRVGEEHQYSSEAQYFIKELRRSSFERMIVLPEQVKGEPEATMKDGILRLTWQLPEVRAPAAKKITIRKE
jgi:HSP20 family molecular chaperone IbpA